MKIVVLDGYTSNPGDISWEPIEKLGDLTVYERTAPEEILERGGDADIIILNKCVLNADVLPRLSKLKFIALLSTGTNAVDLVRAAELGIPVANVPGYSTPSVAQMTFALISELTVGAGRHSASIHAGQWQKRKDFCYWEQPLIELSGKTLGIVGYGSIGRAVEKIASAYGMQVIVTSRTRPADIEDSRWYSLEDMLPAADILTLHCPLTDKNHEMINRAALGKMKPGAFLINTARGGLINEADLAYALNSGMIAGAGLDVLSSEPPRKDNPLLTARNCIITPHIAWATTEARVRLLDEVAANIQSFRQGGTRNVVNGKAGR